MKNMKPAAAPLFLLGAGFGADARFHAGSIRGNSLGGDEHEIECTYPLLSDLPRICYSNTNPPVPPEKVESRLADDLKAGNRKPLEHLCDELSKADYYLGPHLVGETRDPNPYSRFFAGFPSSSFLTYNYDAFVEYALFKARRWSPRDGYGIPVEAELSSIGSSFNMMESQNLVLHLHGSLLLYTREFLFGPPNNYGIQRMRSQENPDFLFDPQSLGNLFYPFTRINDDLSYDHRLTERVIAPIPDKTTGLRKAFVTRTKQKAKELLANNATLVIIGYAFGPTDTVSYSDLVEAFSENAAPRAVIVSPDASRISTRLAADFPGITWQPQDCSFADWVNEGYPGIVS